MVMVFKENINLQLPLTFYSSIWFVFEKVFISKQIAENRFGDLVEIRDKFFTNLMFLAIWFCSSGLKKLENFKIILCDFKNGGLAVLLESS